MFMRMLQTGAAFLLGVVTICIVPMPGKILLFNNVVHAQTSAVAKIAHVFSGSDGQSHAEYFDVGKTGAMFKFAPLSGVAELHRGSPSTVGTWHPEKQRMYVINLSGLGEIEVADGVKVPLGPGQIEFVEDLTGKGHISQAKGTEDRITLWLPLADQTPPAPKTPTGSGKTE
jgi:hypothetical protein